MSIEDLQQRLRAFAAERDWEQFHTPKNLVMALGAEVGELGDLFQWLTAEESEAVTRDPRRRHRVEEEMADVLGYLLRLADVLDVDLERALAAKMAANAEKYPVHLSRGSARKYTDLVEQAGQQGQ